MLDNQSVLLKRFPDGQANVSPKHPLKNFIAFLIAASNASAPIYSRTKCLRTSYTHLFSEDCTAVPIGNLPCCKPSLINCVGNVHNFSCFYYAKAHINMSPPYKMYLGKININYDSITIIFL